MITLTTLVYEHDFDYLFRENSWFLKYQNPLIKNKLVVINNVTSLDRLSQLLKNHPEVDYIFVDKYKESAKLWFDITEETEKDLWYTIPYFCMILHCSEPFVLFCAPDCIPNFGSDFLENSVKSLTSDLKFTTLSTRPEINTGIAESCLIDSKQDTLFNFGPLFHDGFWLSSLKILKEIDYNSPYPKFLMRPPFGAEMSFESRVCYYFHNYRTYRGIYKNNNYYYTHITDKNVTTNYKVI